MPELPEVENVRATIESAVRGARVVGHTDRERPDFLRPVLRGAGGDLCGREIAGLRRHGKQLAMTFTGVNDPVLSVHLGMTGQFRVYPHTDDAADADAAAIPPHTHHLWTVALPSGERLTLGFTDPRRFGRLAIRRDVRELHRRWAGLGPDALLVGPVGLHKRLVRTRRPLKAALLDQQVVAGLGNIYVDELLFKTRLHPLMSAHATTRDDAARLVRSMRTLLTQAIAAGGSSLRDYVDGEGRRGGFQDRHRVYGRAEQPCRRCRRVLRRLAVAGRTTVCCEQCQG